MENGRGGETRITYRASTEYDNTDTGGKERLPFPVWTVSEVSQADGLGHEYVTNYTYTGGMFEAEEREFRGFREVVVRDAFGTETRHVFSQSDDTRGRLLEKEVWGHEVDSNGVLDLTTPLKRFSREETTWGVSEAHGAGVESQFVYVSEQNSYNDEGASTIHTRQRFTYDVYGNLASTVEEGDVNVAGDERRTENVYTYNVASHILNTLGEDHAFMTRRWAEVESQSERFSMT